MSQVSIWLGPPKRKIMMQCLAFPGRADDNRAESGFAAALACNNSGNPRPNMPNPIPRTNSLSPGCGHDWGDRHFHGG